MKLPNNTQIAEAYAEGVDARLARKTFKSGGNISPYTYDNFPGMTYQEFDAYKRPLLNAWFDGFLNKPLRSQP